MTMGGPEFQNRPKPSRDVSMFPQVQDGPKAAPSYELSPMMYPQDQGSAQESSRRPWLRRSDEDDLQSNFETVLIHRNVDELIQQWEERIVDANVLPENSHVIGWNGTTLLWNHRDIHGEVVYMVVTPSGDGVTQADIAHRTKHAGQEHAANLGRGDPDLEKLIVKYFDAVQEQLTKFINKLRSDIQSRADDLRRNLREMNSDEDTNELFKRQRLPEDRDDPQGKQG